MSDLDGVVRESQSIKLMTRLKLWVLKRAQSQSQKEQHTWGLRDGKELGTWGEEIDKKLPWTETKAGVS